MQSRAGLLLCDVDIDIADVITKSLRRKLTTNDSYMKLAKHLQLAWHCRTSATSDRP